MVFRLVAETEATPQGVYVIFGGAGRLKRKRNILVKHS